jgi:hypothetical protein
MQYKVPVLPSAPDQIARRGPAAHRASAIVTFLSRYRHVVSCQHTTAVTARTDTHLTPNLA